MRRAVYERPSTSLFPRLTLCLPLDLCRLCLLSRSPVYSLTHSPSFPLSLLACLVSCLQSQCSLTETDKDRTVQSWTVSVCPRTFSGLTLLVHESGLTRKEDKAICTRSLLSCLESGGSVLRQALLRSCVCVCVTAGVQRRTKTEQLPSSSSLTSPAAAAESEKQGRSSCCCLFVFVFAKQ